MSHHVSHIAVDDDSRYSQVVYEATKGKDVTPTILRDYAIPHALSPDLRAKLLEHCNAGNGYSDEYSWAVPA